MEGSKGANPKGQLKPQLAPNKTGRPGKTVAPVIISTIIIIAVALVFIFGIESDEGNGDGDGHNGDGDDDNGKDNGDNGGDNGGSGNDIIKVITAIEGKKQADATAFKWDSSAELQNVRGFEGEPDSIYLDEFKWVIDHNINTLNDKTLGDGKCIAWEYEYFPADGDIYNRLHVIVFGNDSVIQWKDQKSGSAHTANLSHWQLDSDAAAKIAKTLELYNNLSSEYSVNKYTFYELTPEIWDITLSDISEYIRVKIDESNGEITYNYP